MTHFHGLRLSTYGLFWSCFYIALSASAKNEGIFTGFAPNKISANLNYTIWLAGDLKGANSLPPLKLQINCTITYPNGEVGKKDFPMGEFPQWEPHEPIRASIETKKLFAEPFDACVVNALHLKTLEVLDQFPVTLIREPNNVITGKDISIFIQLDKPAYKPKDTVRMRLVTLNKNRLPTHALPLILTVRDPMNIVIIKETNFPEANKNGIRLFQFQLAKQLNLGSWTLTIESGGVKEVRTFVVEKYVLPKFFVKLVTTPHHLVIGGGGDGIVTVEVQSSYTYGRILEGNCSVRFYPAGRKPEKGQESVKLGDLIRGTMFFRFPAPTAFGEYHIEANVTEKNTGRWSVGKHSFQVYRTDPFKITWLNPVTYYKPGFPLDIQLAISTVDNLPVSDISESALSISSTHQFANGETDIETKTSSIPRNGMVTFNIETPSDSNTKFESIIVRYKQITLNLPLPRLFKSASQLQLSVFPPQTDKSKFQRGSNYEFTVEASDFALTRINYILYDGQNIIDFKVDEPISVAGAVKRGHLSVNLPKGVYTELRIFIFFVHTFSRFGGAKTEELVSASCTWSTNNYIDFSLSQELVEPADNISLIFHTHPGSTIALRGVDQSVLLLSRDKTNLDLDPSTVPYNQFWRARHTLSSISSPLNSVSDFIDDFKIHGLEILSNIGPTPRKRAKRETSEGHHRFIRQAGNFLERPAALDYSFHEGDVRTRKDFPEVWLWDEIEAENETTAFQPKVPKVPDTITSWYISAFSVNKESGIAVTPVPNILTVFRRFFITLNLPYSVIKNEKFAFQVMVHNYLDEDIWAEITFINDRNDFQFVDTSQREMVNITIRKLLPPKTVDMVTFVITPLKLGQLPMQVRALTSSAGDAVIRPLNVIAPGQTYSKNQHKKMINSRNEDGVATERIVTRGRRSLESRSLKFTGDTLAPILDLNTDSRVAGLIRQPGGCGEQSMAGFYPNILALDYLTAAQQLNPAQEQKGKENLLKGYQLQMRFYEPATGAFKYQLPDSTYSTWLSSFILRCFVGARKYITIDDRVLINGIKYLIKQQNINGEFVEYGKNLYPTYFVWTHYDMIGGGKGRRVPNIVFSCGITAYVTLAISEIFHDIKSLPKSTFSDTERRGIEESIEKGKKFVSSLSCLTGSDAYSLAIVTAVLHALDHPSKDKFYDRLETYAKLTQGGTLKHYEVDPNVSEASTTAMSIEITGYALLAQLWRSEVSVANSIPIVKWLFSKRNPQGGFLATQDTVVALTALAKYARMSLAQPTDAMDIQITTNKRDTFNLKVNVNNSVALQEFVLPEDTEWIDITFRGQGRCCMEYQEYHYKSTPNDQSQFKIKAKWTPTIEDSDEAFILGLCVSTTQEERTGDVVSEVNLPTGYAFEEEDINFLMTSGEGKAEVIKNIELKKQGTQAFVYYDSIDQTPTCVDLVVTRLFTVSSRNKAGIFVYEYMDTNKNGSVTYPPALVKTVCELCLETKGCDIVKDCARRRRSL